MTQPRSGAVRVAVGQLIWSSHAAPAARTPRPLAGALAAVSPTPGHAVQPPPRAQGRNGQPPGHRTAGRQPTQPQARCRSLAYLPAHRQPGRPARPAPGNQPNALPQPPAPHPSARPGPAGHQTRPRHPARPAQGRPDLPMSGRGTRRGVRQATVSPTARRRGEEQGSGD